MLNLGEKKVILLFLNSAPDFTSIVPKITFLCNAFYVEELYIMRIIEFMAEYSSTENPSKKKCQIILFYFYN